MKNGFIIDEKELLLSVGSSPASPSDESSFQPLPVPFISLSYEESQQPSTRIFDEESVELVKETDLLSQTDELSGDLTLAQAHREILHDLDKERERSSQLERDLLQTQTEARELHRQVNEFQLELDTLRKNNQDLLMNVTEIEQKNVEQRLIIDDLEDTKKTLMEELVNSTKGISEECESHRNRVKELEMKIETLQLEYEDALRRERNARETEELLRGLLNEVTRSSEKTVGETKSEIMSLSTAFEETCVKLTTAEASLKTSEETIAKKEHELSM